MGERDDKKLTEAIVDAWRFEHRFNEKFHKRDDFDKVASGDLRKEVDWVLKTTKTLRSKRPVEYDADPKEFSRRAKRALEDIEEQPPSERSFAAGGWKPPDKSPGTMGNLLGMCIVVATFLWLFSHCNVSGPGASHEDEGPSGVRYH